MTGLAVAWLLLSVYWHAVRSAQQSTVTPPPAERGEFALTAECKALLHSIGLGIVVVDRHSHILFANRDFLNMFDAEQERVHNEPLRNVLLAGHGASLSLSQRLADLCLQTEEKQAASFDLPLDDGQFKHIQVSASPIRNREGQALGVLLVYQDRTSDREMEEHMRKNAHLETVSQMAASIAHEVRNPMTSVQGFLQLMGREIDPAHTHSKYLHVMEEDLKRINSIITEYLNFSRMGTHDSFEDVWIGTLVANVCTLIESEANLKGISLDLIGDGENPLLIANPNRLKQVLINLARNAMEAMSEDEQSQGGVLRLGLTSTRDEICLTVSDTGPGIPASELSDIFNPFYTTKKTGTGLGLFVCNKIIREHKGTIRVQSEPDHGTTFFIHLPKNRLFEAD
ncbi:MAG TPA: ATP-binding protein [Bacilli bacterium]|nr:ATP-binding protein [Bacilli bacterium]